MGKFSARLFGVCSPGGYFITRRANLDAGCGWLLFFSARSYLECGRQVIAFDQSLMMLKRARARLTQLAGFVPENIILLQADLKYLPFRPASFDTVLCLNVFHQFEDAANLIRSLKVLLVDGGHLYLTSLVLNNRFMGDQYLRSLYRIGEFVNPRKSIELKRLLNDSLNKSIDYKTRGNMAYVTTATPS